MIPYFPIHSPVRSCDGKYNIPFDIGVRDIGWPQQNYPGRLEQVVPEFSLQLFFLTVLIR